MDKEIDKETDKETDNLHRSSNEKEFIHLEATVPIEFAQKRLDQTLAILFPEHSRSRLKDWIELGKVWVDGKYLKPKDKLAGGEFIKIEVQVPKVVDWQEEERIPIDIVYQDEYLLIVNKQANLVVHPAAGNEKGTLVNALLHLIPNLKQLPRAGIVHRLDKNTTGLLVVAKTLASHTALVELLQNHEIQREYQALVWGVMTGGGTVNAAIARHPHDRKRMAVVEKGKPAITHYRVLKRFKSHTLVQVNLETGRTHQIRVHMAYIQFPIVGDKTYGGRLRLPPGATEEQLTLLRNFPRQALHAKKLAFIHPITQHPLEFEAPLPHDFQELLKALSC